MYKNKELLDLSDMPNEFKDTANKKIVGNMKDENCRNTNKKVYWTKIKNV